MRAVSKYVAKEPSAPVSTILRDTVRGAGWTRSVIVRFRFGDKRTCEDALSLALMFFMLFVL